jgi:hypothetical protein
MHVTAALKEQPRIPKHLESPGFWVQHIPFSFYLVQQLKPEIIVELGTHSGNSFFAFCEAVKENNLPTKSYAVDSWQGDEQAGFYAEEVYENVAKHLQENYADNAVLLRMKFDEATPHFENNSIDLLHIDGLHTYEAVKHDFENWLPKLSDKAIVLFHDTQIKEKDFGVWKFWNELEKIYPSFEFYHGCGLGVLAVGKNPSPEILKFIRETSQHNSHRSFFEKQGKLIFEKYRRLQFRRGAKRLLYPHRIIAKRLRKFFS